MQTNISEYVSQKRDWDGVKVRFHIAEDHSRICFTDHSSVYVSNERGEPVKFVSEEKWNWQTVLIIISLIEMLTGTKSKKIDRKPSNADSHAEISTYVLQRSEP